MPVPSLPNADMERALFARGLTRIAGVDEVGRGPLAGPVTAAAVMLSFEALPEGLNDSKRLSPARRTGLADLLWQSAEVSVAHATVTEIEEFNILGAADLAMVRAVAGLPRPPEHALIDGNRIPRGLGVPATPVVRGDAKVLSIAAASIVAKVVRDGLMAELAAAFPGYGWDTNAGYPTPAHRAALKTLGVTPHHRRSFRPVHNILCQRGD